VQFFDVDAPGLAILVIVTRNHINLVWNDFAVVIYHSTIIARKSGVR
jgi:hypothetical protein